jgi:ubiquinone/menaquinone biosynthesis C-methylase UbiE
MMDSLIRYYNQFDEWGRLDREPLEYLINLHHIRRHLPHSGRILDNGAGPGKYSMYLAEQGYQVTLTDLTPRLVELAKQKATELHLEKHFDGFHAMDARNLDGLYAEHFDVALMLGPMYHLQSQDDRNRAVAELYRVTKDEGLVFVAFMSRTRFLSTSLQYPERWRPNHTVQGIMNFMDSGIFNHDEEGRFTGAYYFDISEIIPFMESHGFQTIKLIGSSSIAGGMTEDQWDYWKRQGDDAFLQMMELIMNESENPYILGTSSHLLYIGQKI